MSQFAQSGSAMDSAIGEDGDKGFIGVNQRNPLNQLQPGEVRESVNGRIEGYWKPRKAVKSRTSGLTGGGAALTIPFTLPSAVPINDNAVTNVRASCLFSDPNTSNKEYILIALNSVIKKVDLNNFSSVEDIEIPPAESINSNTDMIQAFDKIILFRDGDQALQWDQNSNNRFYTVPGGPYQANRDYNTNNNVTFSNGVATVTIDTPDLQSSSGTATGVGESFAISSATAGTNIVTIVTSAAHGLTTGNSVLIAGIVPSAGPDPDGVRVVTVVNTTTFTIPLTGATGTYTVTGATVRKASTTIKLPAFFDDGFKPSALDDFYNGSTLVISATTYTISDYDGATRTLTLSTGSFFPDTEYSFSSLKDNPFTIGEAIRITQASSVFKVLQVGDTVNVAELPTYNTWKFYVSEPNGTHTIHYSVAASIGLGFSYMPAPPWGTYFQRRLWVPFLYESKGTITVPSYPSRGITDEIIASDILDSNTYDQILNQFRIGGGSADYVVAMHGFYDDSLIVFNRHSVHAVVGTQGSLKDTVVKELTSEVGCLARKSVVIQGNTLIFLSDNGVYGLEFMNDYNLRGTREPISKNIQPYIDRINKQAASGAIGVYFDNRYYLAVPLDSKVGQNDATQGNNALLIFNFLNGAWESVDTYNTSGFLIQNLIVGKSGDLDALYAISQNGGIHQIDAFDSDVDEIYSGSSASTYPIQSYISTRGYDLGSLERKRFTDTQVQLQTLSGQTTDMDIAFSVEDPDNAQSVGSISDFLGGALVPSDINEEETATIRARLGGTRGIVGSIRLTKKTGSPKIHSLKVAGSVTNRQIISQR